MAFISKTLDLVFQYQAFFIFFPSQGWFNIVNLHNSIVCKSGTFYYTKGCNLAGCMGMAPPPIYGTGFGDAVGTL